MTSLTEHVHTYLPIREGEKKKIFFLEVVYN